MWIHAWINIKQQSKRYIYGRTTWYLWVLRTIDTQNHSPAQHFVSLSRSLSHSVRVYYSPEFRVIFVVVFFLLFFFSLLLCIVVLLSVSIKSYVNDVRSVCLLFFVLSHHNIVLVVCRSILFRSVDANCCAYAGVSCRFQVSLWDETETGDSGRQKQP